MQTQEAMSNIILKPSCLTLTFAIELLMDEWKDCNEGWIELGPCNQTMNITYYLTPHDKYTLDIAIWPCCAKITTGSESCFVRVWQYLSRKWFTFTIQHLLPLRVTDLRGYVLTVEPSLTGGLSGKDHDLAVFLPPKQWGCPRYFAPVLLSDQLPTLTSHMEGLIWGCVVNYIPVSIMDEKFDAPYAVDNIRHRDEIINHVHNIVLAGSETSDLSNTSNARQSLARKDSRKKELTKQKYQIYLTGDRLLAGAGRLVPYMNQGDRPAALGEMVVLISSRYFPADDDLPIFFVNIDCLSQIPAKQMTEANISELYTFWKFNKEERRSERRAIQTLTESVDFDDHHSIPLQYDSQSSALSEFSDWPFEIELYAIRTLISTPLEPMLFNKNVRNKYTSDEFQMPSTKDDEFLVATCKIDVDDLGKNGSRFIRGEYPLQPPEAKFVDTKREAACTSDVNGVQVNLTRNRMTFQILEAQMTLEVSLGFAGCMPKVPKYYSRLLYIFDNDKINKMFLTEVAENVNYNKASQGQQDGLFTGFILNAGHSVMVFLEGLSREMDGLIDCVNSKNPEVEQCYCLQNQVVSRIYPDLLSTCMPVMMLKMHASLNSLLACPQVYVRPALPAPARSALLKLGRLVSSKPYSVPNSSQLPSLAELRSFRLELCAPIKPDAADNTLFQMMSNPQTRGGTVSNAIKQIWDK